MEKDKISIIIPIFNTAPFLERCLESLKSQTYTNMEFIMIDDGSTDGSSIICNQYTKNDERFKYIFQQNSGVSVARNKGDRKSVV